VCAKQAERRFPIKADQPLASNHTTLRDRRPEFPESGTVSGGRLGFPSLTDGLRSV